MSVELKVVVLPDCSLSNLYHLTDMIAKNKKKHTCIDRYNV